MLKSLLRRFSAASPLPQPCIPAGQRVYAIGDIHGRDDLFERLIVRIDADNRARGDAQTCIILLGDLVDRGPDSASVVERAYCLARERGNIRLLSANHEEVFLKALEGNIEALRFFCRIGGEETIWSYGIAQTRYRDMSYEQLSSALQAAVPDHHRAMLAAAEDWLQIGDYIFVHAGIRPGVAMADQKVEDLRWIRQPFLDHPHWHGAMIVHGHTITEAVDDRPNRLGIDTGAYASGRLTAVGLEGAERWFLTS